MSKKSRKKNRGYLSQHIGHIIRCDEWNRGRPVQFEGFTPQGCMQVKDIIFKETIILSEEYLDMVWHFGG